MIMSIAAVRACIIILKEAGNYILASHCNTLKMHLKDMYPRLKVLMD